MAERYHLLPSQLLDLTPEEFNLNAAIYLYASGERGKDRAYEHSQMELKREQDRKG